MMGRFYYLTLVIVVSSAPSGPSYVGLLMGLSGN